MSFWTWFWVVGTWFLFLVLTLVYYWKAGEEAHE